MSTLSSRFHPTLSPHLSLSSLPVLAALWRQCWSLYGRCTRRS
jgi:hypothetical protein